MKESVLQRSSKMVREKGIGVFIKKGSRFLMQRAIMYPYALWRVPREVEKVSNAEAVVGFMFDKLGGLIKPIQMRWEITELARIVEQLHPSTVLEIGTANGGTLFAFARLAARDATLVSVDLPGGYSSSREFLCKKFAARTQKLFLPQADSHKEGTVASIQKLPVGGEWISFL